MFDSKEDAYKIPEYLNGRHHSIKFTIEEEKDGNLPFLDVLISKLEGGTFHTTTYRKPTNTGLLTNFTSFCSYSFKIGLIKTLVDRAYKINSDLLSCTHDHNFISTVLQKNLFPLVLIKRVMNDYMARVPSTNSTEDMNPDVETPVIDKRFYKLPYLGEVSPKTNRALMHLIKRCCSETIDARFVFDTFKIGKYFSAKDPIPRSLRSHVVYHFSCAGCNTCYIGKTARHYLTRADEHLRTDLTSAIYKHLDNNPHCKRKCNTDCFSILDNAQTSFSLGVKEALYVAEKKPALNIQKISYKMKLLL